MAKKKTSTVSKASFTGPKSDKYLRLSQKYEARCMTSQAPVVLERGRGCTIWDVDGKEYLDLTSGVLVANVGHCHPKLVRAIQAAAERLLNVYDFPTPARVSLARRLVELTPENLDRAFLLTTGAETTEAAMRCAKRRTGRNEIVSFWGAFHGRTYAAMSVGGKMSGKRKFGTLMPGVIFAPYAYCYRCPIGMKYPRCRLECVNFIDKVVDAEATGDIAALIVEPYQGAAGFIVPPEGWLTRVQQWCRDHDVLFILDEVQSSFGRTGKMFALEWEDLRPNLLCLGKGIGSGAATSALMAESHVMACLEAGEMSSTLGGNPLSCSASLAVLEIMEEEKLAENARRMGDYMLGRFKRLARKSKILGDARGRGLAMGLEIVKDKKTKEPAPDLTVKVIYDCVRRGLLCGRVGLYGSVIRVAPPLVITAGEAEKACNIMEKAVLEVGK